MRGFAFVLLAACAAVPLAAQAPSAPAPTAPQVKEPFVKASAEEAVRELATKLEENFVFPDKGKAYAEMLRANLAAGKYSSFPDAVAFARAVTADLQSMHEDRHLAVRVVPPEVRAQFRGEGPARSGPSQRRRAPAFALRRPGRRDLRGGAGGRLSQHHPCAAAPLTLVG